MCVVMNYFNLQKPLFQMNNFVFQNKFPILITLIFFLIFSYIAFFHHLYFSGQEQDGIFYLFNGRQFFDSDLDNIDQIGAPMGGPILYSLLESFFGDAFSSYKAISIISGTSIVFITYFITRNIFGTKIALLSQILVAINVKLQFLTISALNELAPIALIVFSFFFISKKQLNISHLMMIGFLLGLAFMFRYQSIFIFIGFIIFLLIRNKKIRINLTHFAIVSIIFLMSVSPLLVLNYNTYGSFLDNDSGYYFLVLFKYQTPEWRETITEMKHEGLLSLILADSDLFFKNYFYNLLSNNPNRIFNFGSLDNLSILPFIPIIGFVTVSLGFISHIKPSKDKRILFTFLISGFILFLIFLMGDIQLHYFGIIFFPLLIFGIFYINRIQSNFLPLLVISIVFFFALSILPAYRSYQFLILLIPFSILNSIFLIDVLGKINLRKIFWRNNYE